MASKVSTFRGSIKGCGITVPIDRSNDATINIRGLNDYDVPTWRSNKTLNTKLAGDLEGSESECYTEGPSVWCETDTEGIFSNTGSGSESETDSEAVAGSEVGPEVEHSLEVERQGEDKLFHRSKRLRSSIRLGEQIV